jgi:hypothetical protein
MVFPRPDGWVTLAGHVPIAAGYAVDERSQLYWDGSSRSPDAELEFTAPLTDIAESGRSAELYTVWEINPHTATSAQIAR